MAAKFDRFPSGRYNAGSSSTTPPWRNGSRTSTKPCTAAGATQPVVFDPAKHIAASSGPPYVRPVNGPTGPSEAYLAVTTESSTIKNSEAPCVPPLLLLDLNGTLCVRPQRNAVGAHHAIPRPYVSNFLEYVLGYDETADGPRKRFEVMVCRQVLRSTKCFLMCSQVWTSAQPRSAGILLESLGLAQKAGFGVKASGISGYEHLNISLLKTVWDRHAFGLTPEEFQERTATIKDLDKVWHKFDDGGAPTSWSQKNTIILDDAAHVAIAQPNNLLLMQEFKLTSDELAAYARQMSAGPRTPSGISTIEACASDSVMLQTIGKFDMLRKHSNVSAVLKDGRIEGDDRTEAQWEIEGKNALKDCGIALSKAYDSAWTDRIVAA